MKVEEILNGLADKLNGRKISESEKKMLINELGSKLVPDWYLDILCNHPLAGTSFSISEDKDLSEMGVEMKWLDPSQTLNEAKESYPGIIAINYGFLPVGMCLEGSGDPYFLKIDGSVDPEVVRIYHDSDDETFFKDGIDLVCGSLGDFFIKSYVE